MLDICGEPALEELTRRLHFREGERTETLRLGWAWGAPLSTKKSMMSGGRGKQKSIYVTVLAMLKSQGVILGAVEAIRRF